MDDQLIPTAEEQQTITAVEKPVNPLKEYEFKPGQSGNPSGRPKMTEEQKELLKDIKGLAPKAFQAMVNILDSPKVMAMAKVKVIELILNYTLGKPESNIKLTIDPAQQTIASEMRIAALVQSIQIQIPPDDKPSIMDNNYTPEQMQRMGLIVPDDEKGDGE